MKSLNLFIVNDEMKIWRKNQGRLILQHRINKYKLFKKFFFFNGCIKFFLLNFCLFSFNRCMEDNS